jgi:hypothetical protein
MALNVFEMFANALNDEVLDSMTNEELKEVMDILDKAGY